MNYIDAKSLPDKVNPYLATDFIGRKIVAYDSVASTNIEAKKNADLADGTVFVSTLQSAGRGRLGRAWQSDNGGLWFSILLKPKISADTTPLLTLVAGLSVCEAIERGAMIKWPNDIVLNTKKASGILCERTQNGEVILGIGINVYSYPTDISISATSLLNEGFEINAVELFCTVLNRFEENYKSFIQKGFKTLSDAYKAKCITLNRDVVVNTSSGEIYCKAIDISDKGELIVKSSNKTFAVSSGEVSVRGLLGYI